MPGTTAKQPARPGPGASGRPTSQVDASASVSASVDSVGTTPDTLSSHPSTDAARLRRLIEAQAIINSDLSLSDMLQRIVRTACELVGARYGALGVIGHDGALESLVHFGLDDATVAAMGPLPVLRHGLLGAMIDDPSPVRVDDIAADPRSAGFPPNHPPMRTFLGVPIRVRGEVYGDIYLSEAAAGRFTAADEELVAALASTAGTAIANARLYEDARRSRDWLFASGEVTRALLAEADVDTLLDVVSRALQVAEADLGMLVLPDDDGRLRTTVSVGLGADRYRDFHYPVRSSGIGRLIADGRRVLQPDLDGLTPAAFDNRYGFGPIMVAPLADAKGVRGSIVLVRVADRPAFTTADLDLATTFADHVALALDMNDSRHAAEQLRVLEVRHQIAQDLHDNVIQRLFATGMGLHHIADADLPGPIAARLARHVGDLDETIDEIRERIFGLREDSDQQPTGRNRFPRMGPYS